MELIEDSGAHKDPSFNGFSLATPLKTFMGFSVHLNVQLKFYNLPNQKIILFFENIEYNRWIIE